MNKFLAGALVGVAIGLLIAPEKGEDMRNDIADSADKLRDKFNKLVGKASTTVDDLKAFLEKNIDGLSDDVKYRILTILDEVDEMSYTAKTHLGNGVV